MKIWWIPIVCNLVWSAHPVMAKELMNFFEPSHAAFLRYSLGWVSILILALGVRILRPSLSETPWVSSRKAQDHLWLLLLGFCAFCFSPLFQFIGLHSSQAVSGALVIAMEPMVTVALAWFFLKEAPSRRVRWALLVSIIGFFILSEWNPLSLLTSTSKEPSSGLFWGNILMLISLCGEASYSLIGRKISGRFSSLSIMGESLFWGVLFLGGALFFIGSQGELSAQPSAEGFLKLWNTLSNPGQLPWTFWVAWIWIAPFGTALAYGGWMLSLKKLPVAQLSLTLFIQPVMGPIWGIVLRGETYRWPQAIGSALILGAVYFQTREEVKAPIEPRA